MMESNSPKKKTSTIKEVALMAGVSIGTVSRFLNGYKVKERNRVAIQNAIETLDYTVDFIAKSMKTKNSSTIGLLVSGFDQFSSGVIANMSQILRSQNYTLITLHHNDDISIFQEAFDFFRNRNMDAIAMANGRYELAPITKFLELGKPVVVFNNDIEELPIDKVFVDDHKAMYRAVSYLLQMGHRRIGFITGKLDESSAAKRFEGYKAALRDAHIDIDPSLIMQGSWTPESGYQAMKNFTTKKLSITALVSSNYPMTMGAMQALKELGISIPDDLSLITYDDPPFLTLYTPPITAIAQPIDKIAYYTSSYILDRLHGEYTGKGRTVLLEADLIIRDSVKNLNTRP